MDVFVTDGRVQKLLTSDLVAQIIGDGNQSDFEESDLEDQLLQYDKEGGVSTSSDEDVQNQVQFEPEYNPLESVSSSSHDCSSRCRPCSRGQNKLPSIIEAQASYQRQSRSTSRSRSVETIVNEIRLEIEVEEFPQPVPSFSREQSRGRGRAPSRGSRRSRGRSSFVRENTANQNRSRSTSRSRSVETLVNEFQEERETNTKSPQPVPSFSRGRSRGRGRAPSRGSRRSRGRSSFVRRNTTNQNRSRSTRRSRSVETLVNEFHEEHETNTISPQPGPSFSGGRSRGRPPSRSSRRGRGRSSSERGSTANRGRSRSDRRSKSADIDQSRRLRLWRQISYDDKDHSLYTSYPEVLTCRPPLECFKEYFDDDFFKNCAECTNNYYMRKTGRILNTTTVEMKKFFGVLLVMGCITYPRIHMYWRQNMALELVSRAMTRDRFFLLRNNIHVVSTDTAPPENTNPLWKVQPAIDAVRKACTKLERIPGYYSIDEQMIPFTGRCRIRVLVRNKPRPVGLKNYVVTTSEGLMINFEIYYPQNPAFDRSLGEGPAVILFLAQSIPRGSCIYFDRYFTTIPLLDKLSEIGLHGTGTIMANRIPNGKNLKLSEKAGMKRGDIQQFVSGDVVVVKWMDNNVVLMASNCTGGDNIKYIPRWDKKRKEYIPVKAPEVVMNYNKRMGGVDILDQAIEYYRTFQKTKKWTVKVLIHLLDLAAANSWRQYKITQQNQGLRSSEAVKDLLWFRLDLADSLINCPGKDRHSSETETTTDRDPTEIQYPGRYKPPPAPSTGKRYDGYDHLPHFDNSIDSPRCCRMEGCKSRSKIVCTKCKVYLCLSRANNCFFEYHKK